MSQATFSVRMDEGLKRQFDGLCQEFGMTASTAINVFARAVVRERRIPFDIAAPEPEVSRDSATRAFMALRAEARANGIGDLSQDEINEETRLTREEREA